MRGQESTINREELNRDLGFGSEVSRRARRRLLNRDGTFNVRREGTSLLSSRSFYHLSLSTTWPRFFLAILGIYLSINLVFSLLYFACGPAAFQGMTTTSDAARFMDCYFFSVQTFATIGYGRISPVSLLPNLVVTLEALVGLVSLALATGICFSRFSRPNARLLFSDNAIIAPYRGITAFEFRLANQRSNQLLHVEARVILSRNETDADGVKRRFHELELERSKVIFFPLSWTIVHPITETSPLYNVTPHDLAEADAEFLVLLAGIDDTFSQQVNSCSSYKFDELVWGARFVNILEEQDDGIVHIDLARINEIEKLNGHHAGAPALP